MSMRLQRGTARVTRARGQNAIMDRGLATILTTAGIIGALASFYIFSPNNSATAEKSQIAAIGVAVDMLYKGVPDYTSLTTPLLVSFGALPTQWVQTGAVGAQPTIVSMFRSAITVAPVTNVLTGLVNGAWTLTIAAVPQSSCIVLATSMDGPNEFGVAINGVGAPTGPSPTGVNPLPTTAAAAIACNKTENSMAFYLN